MRFSLTAYAVPLSYPTISSIYALTFGGFLLVGARTGDLLSRRRVFITGLVVFSLASLAICFAVSPAMLVISLAVQGLGAAIVAPSSLALLQAEFAPAPFRSTQRRAVSRQASA